MFLSYEETKYLGYDEKTKLYRWEYKIVDSEFEEIGVGTFGGGGVSQGLGTGLAVIDTYENRNLNVAVNLVKSFIWLNKEYGWSINNTVKYNKQYNPKFAKYEEDVNKYLILM